MRLIDRSLTHFVADFALHAIDAHPEIDKLLFLSRLYLIRYLDCTNNRSPTCIAAFAKYTDFNFPSPL